MPAITRPQPDSVRPVVATATTVPSPCPRRATSSRNRVISRMLKSSPSATRKTKAKIGVVYSRWPYSSWHTPIALRVLRPMVASR